MRKNLLQFSLLLITTFLFSTVSWGQTNPSLHNLGVSNYTFNDWPAASAAGTYPASMRFWRTGTQDPTLAATANADWTGAYNLTSDPRFNGLGTDGFSFINTGSSGNIGMAVVGLNATGREDIQVSWTGGTVAPNSRTYAIRLQYRVGSGAWTDVPGPVEYVRNSAAGHSQTFGPTTLPSAVNGEAEVYVRWFYYYVSGSGNRPQLRVGDISITSTAAGGPPVASANVSSNFTPFTYALNEGPSSQQSFTVSGVNLTNDIVISVPTNFEHSLNAAGPYQTTDINLSPSSGTVNSTDVFVRMVAGLGGGSYGGDITVSSDDPSSPAEVAIAGVVLSETLPYFEDFGATAGVFPLGWTTSGPGAANWTIGTSTSSSDDIPTASGGANLQDNGSVVGQEAIVTINRAISTVGADEVLVSFLARRTSAYSGNVELDYSTDGFSWNNVPFADVANNATWAPVVVSLTSAAANVPNLRLRLRTTRTSTSGNYRIDDFRVLEPTKFFYQNGPLHETSSWIDASSTNPVNFTNDNQIFVIEGSTNVTTTSAFTVSGSNSRIIVGDGLNNTSLTIAAFNGITGTIQVRDNATLTLNSTTVPTLSGLEDNSTVVYNMNPGVTIQSVAYGNLTVRGAGTKTFPNSTIAVNGNLVYEDVTLAFDGTSSRIDYSGNITLVGTVSYSGSIRPEYRITANSNAQTINTGSATLEAFNFYAQNKTGGSLSLAAANANIRALNNLRLNFPAGVAFNDGGNTIIFGDDLRVQGDEASYTLTGTLRLQATGGTNDFENIAVPLNNLEIVVTGIAVPQFADGSNTDNITINGNLLVDLEDLDLVMNDVTLNIGGDFTFNSNGDGRIDSGTSTVVFNGSGAQSITLNETATLNNLTINNSGTATISGDGELVVLNVLTLTSGALATGDKLVLRSIADKTAQVAPVTPGFNLQGKVTAERFIPKRSDDARAFRFLSSPVGGVDIADSWQLNTHITGAAGTVGETSAQGFDETQSGAPSMFFFDHSLEVQTGTNVSAAWVPIASTTQDIVAGRPYRLFVRGDRTVSLANNEAPATDVTLSATGNLHVGDYPVTVSNFVENFTFIGNPYQAVVDISEIDFGDDVNDNFAYYWDPSLHENGGFIAIALPSGNLEPVPNPASSNANNFLRPGQAVFVRNNNTGSAFGINITEGAKATSGSQTQVFSTTTTAFVNARLYTTEKFNNGQIEEDAVGLRFLAEGNNAIDPMDAVKMGNPGVNLALVNGNTPLAIETRALPENGEQIQLFINNLSTDNYTFRFHTENLPMNTKVFIKDAYLDTQTEVEAGIDTYSFTIDSSIEASASPFRFSFVFEDTTLSTDQFDLTTSVEVYPNPTTNVLNVRSKMLANQEVNVKILDVLGRSVQNLSIFVAENATIEVNTSELQQGLYFINVSTSTGETLSERFIKK